MSESRDRVRKLAAESLQSGDFRSWFEKVYAASAGETSGVPWADLVPNPNLVSWQSRNKVSAGRALVIACGLGDDAEFLAEHGMEVTAFDISQTCVDWCKERFPKSPVAYQCEDLFELPQEWRGHFDFIFEANTLQCLPESEQATAMGCIADCLAVDGDLLICARLREDDDERGELPWPLRERDFNSLEQAGLKKANWEDFVDNEDPPVRRVRVLYRREDA
jgi:hypothetical protein